jgi:hypothetical protein
MANYKPNKARALVLFVAAYLAAEIGLIVTLVWYLT